MRRAPKVFILAIVLLLPASARGQKMVWIVRHAEKQSDSNEPSTPLSDAGRARAARLADLLKDAGVTAILSTNTVRTRSTAEPLARRRNLTIQTYAAQTPQGQPAASLLVETLRRDFARDVVLVVGHSNTVPELIQALGCREPVRIAPDEYDNLFLVVAGEIAGKDPVLIRLRY